MMLVDMLLLVELRMVILLLLGLLLVLVLVLRDRIREIPRIHVITHSRTSSSVHL
jgi:hypothetical protein